MARKKKEEVIDVEPVEVFEGEPDRCDNETPVTDTPQGNVTRMNMHRLLRRLKTYDDRINKLLREGQFVAAISSTDKDFKNVEDVAVKIKSDFQKLNALINNKTVLEQAKIMSNSKTKCVIAGQEYTVAEAIKRKEKLAMEKSVLSTLKAQKRVADANIGNEIDRLNMELNKKIKSIFGETPTDHEAVEAYIKKFSEENAPIDVDPLNIVQLIDFLEKSITEFEIEVDSVLNESNAITMVEVVLDGNE